VLSGGPGVCPSLPGVRPAAQSAAQSGAHACEERGATEVAVRAATRRGVWRITHPRRGKSGWTELRWAGYDRVDTDTPLPSSAAFGLELRLVPSPSPRASVLVLIRRTQCHFTTPMPRAPLPSRCWCAFCHARLQQSGSRLVMAAGHLQQAQFQLHPAVRLSQRRRGLRYVTRRRWFLGAIFRRECFVSSVCGDEGTELQRCS